MPFGEVGIMIQEAIGIADGEQSRDHLKVRLFGDALDPLHVPEIVRIHLIQNIQLVVGEQDVSVPSLGGALKEGLGGVDVLVDHEILGAVDPLFASGGLGVTGGSREQQQKGREGSWTKGACIGGTFTENPLGGEKEDKEVGPLFASLPWAPNLVRIAWTSAPDFPIAALRRADSAR